MLAGHRDWLRQCLIVIVSGVDGVADTVTADASTSAGSSPSIASSVVFAMVTGIAAASVLGADPQGWFPFAVAKWWLVVVAVLVATAVVLWNGTPSRSAAGAALAVLLGLITASAVTALDARYAWFGTPVRHLGATAWWLFGLAFVVGASVVGRNVRSRDRSAMKVAHTMTAVGALLGVYAVWELLIARPIDYVTDSQRLGGPYGSAAYLGAACCLFLPIAAAVALDRDQDRRWRAVASVSLVGCGVGLVGSGSRAALAALLVAGPVAAVVRRGALAERWRSRPILVGGVVLAVVAGSVVLALARNVFQRPAGWSSRLDEWHLAVQAIASRPVLGAGPEGYRIVAFELADDSYVVRYGEGTFVDRAHSGVLDVAVASGLFAAVAYLVVIGLVLRSAVLAVRRGSVVTAGLACAVIAYAIGQQLLFPVAEIDPLFWLLAGVVCTGVTLEGRTDETTARRGGGRFARRGTALALLVMAGVATVFGVRAVAADRLSADAVDATSATRAAELTEQAIDLASTDVRHLLLSGRISSGMGTLRGVDQAIVAVEEASRISPRDPAVRLERARLLALRASITGTPGDRSAARSAWAELVDAAPSCARCHLGSALAALERGDDRAAVDSLERAASLGSRDAERVLDRLDLGS